MFFAYNLAFKKKQKQKNKTKQKQKSKTKQNKKQKTNSRKLHMKQWILALQIWLSQKRSLRTQ